MARRISSPVFIGRREALGDLMGALARSSEGAAAVALVQGEAGIGKTRLVNEFAVEARAAGALILAGSCLELTEGALPFGPWIQALRPLGRGEWRRALDALPETSRATLAPVLPGLEDGGQAAIPAPADPSSRARLFELLLNLVERLGHEGPLVVILEDLQWADRSSLDLLTFLGANLRAERVLLLLTCRGDALVAGHPLQGFLTAVERQSAFERIDLRPFDRRELELMLTAIAGAPPDEQLLDRVAGRSGGNPLFAEELLASIAAGERSIPLTLQGALLERVRLLSDPAQALLGACSVAGRAVDEELLQAVLGGERSAVEAALREAVTGNVLEVDKDPGRAPDSREGFVFRHALVGEAVYARLLPAERRRLHASVATALMASTGPVGAGRAAELAYHWEAAGRRREALIETVAAGAWAVESYAFAEGRRHYEHALALWPGVPDAAEATRLDRSALRSRAAEAAWFAGDLAEAVTFARDALIDPEPALDPVRVGVMRQRLGSYLSAAGDDTSAIEVLRGGLELLPASSAPAERARTLATMAAVLMLMGRHGESRAACEEALELMASAAVPELEGQVRDYLGVDLVNLGEVEAGLESLRDALRITQAGAPPDAVLDAYNNLAYMLFRADRYEEAVSIAGDGVAVADRVGLARLTGAILRATLAEALHRLGRWPEAQAVLDEGLRVDPQGDGAVDLLLGRARLRIGRGQLDEAQEDLAHVRRLAEHAQRTDTLVPLEMEAAELALWRGQPQVAQAAIEAGLGHLAGNDQPFLQAPLLALGLRAAADRAEAARARRETRGASDALEAARLFLARIRRLARGRVTSAMGAHRSISAAVATSEAEWTRAQARARPDLWQAAASAWAGLGVPYLTAYAQWRMSEALLAHQGPKAEAVRALGDAREQTLRLGAAPLLQRIDTLARRARLTLDLGRVAEPVEPAAAPAPAATAPAATAAYGLTRREAEVLELVAAGRTNRQIAEGLFITEKTAGIHVSNILGKLGVSSRYDAAALAQQAGILPADGRPIGGVVGSAGSPRTVRTFLVTDIVASTQLVEAIGDEAWESLRKWHDAALRRVVAAGGGEEIDHVGDGFLVAFASASSAIECAVAIQRVLAEHRRAHGFAPSVRIGLHSAEVTSLERGYTGLGVHVVHRIAALASGGEIMASEETAGAGGIRSMTAPTVIELKGVSSPPRVVRIDWHA